MAKMLENNHYSTFTACIYDDVTIILCIYISARTSLKWWYMITSAIAFEGI